MEIKRINWHSPLPIGEAILIALGFVLYALKGFEVALALQSSEQ